MPLQVVHSVTCQGLWTYSLQHRPDLAHMYVAYHHLRAEVCNLPLVLMSLHSTSWVAQHDVCLLKYAVTSATFHFGVKHLVQGLLVRSGLQYGADFITYSDHPSRVHAEFCVLVQPTQQPSRLSWEDLEIVNRLSHQASLLTFCLLIWQQSCKLCIQS